MPGSGSRDADVIVTGAGAVGAATALHLARRGLSVLVVEKEAGPARHQSGRNSGVLHAGYNLKPGSDKARYCVEGNRQARAFCAEHGVAVRDGGILVVARTEQERATLDELQRRATGNGVQVRRLDREGLRSVEPAADGIDALQAPEAASLDAVGFVQAMVAEAEAAGARFLYSRRVLSIDDGAAAGSGGQERGGDAVVATDSGPLRAKVVVNCAGLHADRLARELAADVRVVPFRGFYAELVPARRDLVRSHVYAAPDLAFPFLGVHLSHRFDGRVIVGPGAMLAFGREAYSFARVQPRDLWATLAWPGFWRMMADRRMRSLAWREGHKSLRLRAIWDEARRLVPDLRPGDLVRSYAGNRAQLVDRQGRLVEDIVVRSTARALHVLNAVSPGLTCSLPFGAHLADRAAEMAG